MLKILLTGGGGFIAKNILEAFNNKFRIISFDKKALNLLDSEKVFNYIKQNKFDVVIHSATYDAAPFFSTKDPAKVLENNLQMFFNIARCKKKFGKMIYFGSGAEFGREYWKPKMKEEYYDAHIPTDQYGFSKYIMAKHAELSDNIYNLRLFGLFGKYDDWRYRFIPNVCCQALFDMPITINKNVIFDFLFINDLLKIVKWFLTHQPSQKIYNVCSGITYEFKALAEKIIEISGKKLDIKFKQEGFGKEYSGDNSLLLKELNSFKFTPIEQSIKDLYQWYEQHIHLIDKKQLVSS